MSFDIEPIIISLTIWKNIVIIYMHNTDIIIISSTRNKLIKIYIYIYNYTSKRWFRWGDDRIDGDYMLNARLY